MAAKKKAGRGHVVLGDLVGFISGAAVSGALAATHEQADPDDDGEDHQHDERAEQGPVAAVAVAVAGKEGERRERDGGDGGDGVSEDGHGEGI